MKINHTFNGTSLTVSPEGRLDTVTAPALDAFLAENLAAAASLTFDLAGLDYISSAGLRTLLTAKKKMAGKDVRVINPNDIVREIFEVTGFADIFELD